MRIAALATSAVLLSGCSWLGLGNTSADKSWDDYYRGAQAAGRYNSSGAQHSAQAPRQGYVAPRSYGPCEITSVAQPVPQGCAPEQVTIALPGGQYGGAHSGQGYAGNQYSAPATGSYGRSLGDINRAHAAANQGIHNNWIRPRFRLTGTAGIEKFVSGDAYNGSALPQLYNPATHFEATQEGSQADGQIITNRYEPRVNNVPGTAETIAKAVDMGDLYSTPFTLGLGAEYQLNDRMSVFGNASHTAAQGLNGSAPYYEADVHQISTVTNYIENPLNPGTYINDGAPVTTNTSRPDIVLARTTAEVSALKRTNLEVGGRYYFKDVFPQYLERPLTPYVGAAAGASHYNALEVRQENEELLLTEFWGDASNLQYSREATSSAMEVLEEGWVPTGALTVGAEWQVTPKAALAFETGVRYEGGRDYTAGGETNGNIAIPLTLRGSIGF